MLESYSEWRETFSKVTIDANYIEYGDVIGEGKLVSHFSYLHAILLAVFDIQVSSVKSMKRLTMRLQTHP